MALNTIISELPPTHPLLQAAASGSSGNTENGRIMLREKLGHTPQQVSQCCLHAQTHPQRARAWHWEGWASAVSCHLCNLLSAGGMALALGSKGLIFLNQAVKSPLSSTLPLFPQRQLRSVSVFSCTISTISRCEVGWLEPTKVCRVHSCSTGDCRIDPRPCRCAALPQTHIKCRAEDIPREPLLRATVWMSV